MYASGSVHRYCVCCESSDGLYSSETYRNCSEEKEQQTKMSGGGSGRSSFCVSESLCTTRKTGVLTIVLRVVCAVFMIWIAYEIQDVKHMTGAALFFFGMTFLTGGFWMAVSENRRVTAAFFLSCAAVTYGGLSLMICLMEQIKESREHIYPVALKYHGQLQETYGLYDTGNRLCDTVTGAPVSVADPEILRSLLSEELTDRLLHLKERPEEIESTEIADLKPHYLSFQTVGREVQLILAVTLEDLCIQIPGERIHVSGPVFALSSEPFALGKEYKVILNSRLLH